VSKAEGTTQQGGQHLPVASKMGGTTQRGGTNLLVTSKMGITTQRGGQHLLVASKMGQTTQQGGRNLLIVLFVVTVGSIATWPLLPFIVAVGTGSMRWVVNGGECEVEAMSWHIIDVMGHGVGNPVIRAEGMGSVRVGKVQPVPVPGIPYP